MPYLRHTILTLTITTISCNLWAQQNDAAVTQRHLAKSNSEVHQMDHATHMHKETMAAMDDQMKAMHAMHEKMINSKTLEERKALMDDHMKTMQDGMATIAGTMCSKEEMHDMKGMNAMTTSAKKSGMHKEMNHHQMMEKRMEMIITMMQMMMDRLPTQTAQ